jgi:hypothetical protein
MKETDLAVIVQLGKFLVEAMEVVKSDQYTDKITHVVLTPTSIQVYGPLYPCCLLTADFSTERIVHIRTANSQFDLTVGDLEQAGVLGKIVTVRNMISDHFKAQQLGLLKNDLMF